jgi:putative ABC transport system substrate-binding protein
MGVLIFLFSTVYLLCSFAEAQVTSRVARIGYLHSGAKPGVTDRAFQEGLRELGYLQGKNIALEYRYADGKPERFPELAADLVHSKVDVIVAVNEGGARAAKTATQTIPIIMVGVGPNPVEVGLVDSLAHPGGNLTGLTLMAVELTGKRLELFK